MRNSSTLCWFLVVAAGCSSREDSSKAAVDASTSQVRDRADSKVPRVAGPTRKRPARKVTPRDDHPIPQDLAKAEKLERERLEWHLRTSVGAYDKVGKKDPRWDDLARKAVELAARNAFEIGSKVTFDEVNKAAKAAVDAGCDDPLLAMIFAQTSTIPDASGRENLVRLRRDATKAYAASLYPAFRRAGSLESFASALMGGKTPDDAARKEIEADLDASLALLAEGAKSDEHNGFWVDKWHDTVIGVIRDYRKLGVSPEAAYERADAKMAKIPELEAMRLMVRGTFWFDYGWEARTKAFAPGVPAGGFESLEERLEVARKAFEEAWKLRPDSDYVAVRLLEIDKSIGGDRANMELWFDRAMKANADSRRACWSKLDWLDPKWHGTVEEMLAFGRQCRDTGNWKTGITLLVADAHWRAACKPGQNQNQYLARPEVWDDIQSVYEEYLEHHPVDDLARSKFATFAYLGGHYREAEVQYVALGDRLKQWSEFPYVPLGQLKQNRARNARLVMGKEGRLTFPGWHFLGSTYDDGEWRINLPDEAVRQEKPGIPGGEASFAWNCIADGIVYEIRLLGVPPDLRGESPERALDAARSLAARERGAEPRDLRDTVLAARPAQEYYIDPPGLKPKQTLVKAIVIGPWLFQLAVTAGPSDLSGDAATEFFDSFAFQPKAK